ncbi:hypothetical protein Q6D67_16035 [Haliea sp. E1-2-M8]|uniref:hypothetical protein n=1 Tax=Haliea sp. E1-2-M8 TaxID=3064706 RepID=UPI00272700B1|nr:hypothetical protein [Haliea sp. E1-2-M8]MDO8863216.1 hypothetical protein [Haliea sp. E1-2-M8]
MDNAINDSAPVTASASGISTGLVALAHLVIVLVLLGLFSAADSWYALSNRPLVAALSVASGLIAGAIVTTLVHEWFHFAGAFAVRGHCNHVKRVNLFAFEWNFKRNSRGQFLTMSYAGTLGSVVAIAVFLATIPIDAPGPVALLAAAFGSLAFAGAIEWPVLARVHAGGDPLTELSRITPKVLLLSAATSLLTVLVAAWLLA